MTSYYPPKKNSAFVTHVCLVSQADTDVFQSAPTLAAGDVKVRTDDGALTNLATLPVATGKVVKVSLSAAEMNGDVITVLFSDAAGGEWQDKAIVLHTAENTQDELVDAICDEPLTGVTHNVPASLGRRIRELASTVIRYEAIVSATTNTVTLDAGASSEDNVYTGDMIVIMSGTGIGQARVVVEYDGDAQVVTIDRPWQVNPSAADEYIILAFAQELVVTFGTATAATASTLQLGLSASAVDNIYRYNTLVVTSASGAETLARLITGYVGSTRTVTVSPAFSVTPSAGDVYKIMPIGRGVTESMSDDAISAGALATAAVTKIAAGIWAYASRTLTQTAAQITAILSGSTITAQRGDTLTATITTLGSLAGRTKLWFTVKESKADADSASIIQIEETVGLVYFNGAAGTAGNGSLTVDDEAAGDITVVLAAADADDLEVRGALYYDVQMLSAAGVTTLTSGTFSVEADVTRVIA
jgi:hypothetical protein